MCYVRVLRSYKFGKNEDAYYFGEGDMKLSLVSASFFLDGEKRLDGDVWICDMCLGFQITVMKNLYSKGCKVCHVFGLDIDNNYGLARFVKVRLQIFFC